MGLIEQVQNRSVFLDTAPVIYYIEENKTYSGILNMLFEMNLKREVQLITSTVSLLEVLVIPLRTANFDLADQYKALLCNSDTFSVREIDMEIAERAAGLRAKYRLKTPDAIQLATALCQGADYFLTNDKQLKTVFEIDVLVLDESIK